MRSIFRRTTHFFKERAPELHVAYRAASFHPRTGECRVSWRFIRFGSPVRAARRRIAPTLLANWFSSDAPFGSLPAGPHERFRPSTTQSAFHRQRVFRRTGRPINDFCNRREGRAHPGAARHPARRRVERRRVAIEGLRAAEHRLPGWESSSRSTGHPDSTKLRHECTRGLLESKVGTLVGQRNRPKTRSGLQCAPCPKARLRPTARTVRPSNEPGCLHVARNPGSSPWPLE